MEHVHFDKQVVDMPGDRDLLLEDRDECRRPDELSLERVEDRRALQRSDGR